MRSGRGGHGARGWRQFRSHGVLPGFEENQDVVHPLAELRERYGFGLVEEG